MRKAGSQHFEKQVVSSVVEKKMPGIFSDDANKVLDYIDDAMNSSNRITQGSGFVVELADVIGTARATTAIAAGPTKKVFILLRNGVIHTAYPTH